MSTHCTGTAVAGPDVVAVGAFGGVVGAVDGRGRDALLAESDGPPPHAAATSASPAPPLSASSRRRVIEGSSGREAEGSGVGEGRELRGGSGIALKVRVEEPRDQRAHINDGGIARERTAV